MYLSKDLKKVMLSSHINSVGKVIQASSVQSLSRVRLFATPWTTACQASLSITNSQSLLKLMSIESVMPSSHLILSRPLLLLPPIPIYLGPNSGGGNEDNGDFLQKISCMYCYTQCPQPCSRPPPTLTSTGDFWTPTGKSGTFSVGSLLSPGS